MQTESSSAANMDLWQVFEKNGKIESYMIYKNSLKNDAEKSSGNNSFLSADALCSEAGIKEPLI